MRQGMNRRKVVVVTGSTSGIGLGIARTFASNGYDIGLNGFGSQDDIQTIESDLKENSGARVFYSNADMSKPNEIERYVHDAKEALGTIDVLVNNAGVQHVSSVEDFPTDKWDLVLAVNLSSAFHMTRLILPGMRNQGFGRIINIASAHGLIASPKKSAYVAAKHGLVGLTKTVALEVAEFGLTCNAICPGWVETPLVKAQVEALSRAKSMSEDEVVRSLILERQPTRKFVQIDQVAALALFLASDQASSITGSAYSIDGGWTAH